MRGLPQFPMPPAPGVKQMNLARKSRYTTPSDKTPEPQKAEPKQRPSVMPGWARKYRAVVID